MHCSPERDRGSLHAAHDTLHCAALVPATSLLQPGCADFVISVRQLNMFLSESSVDVLPLKVCSDLLLCF